MITQKILIDLKKTGYKLTTPRKEILKVLSVSNPLGANEVAKTLKEKGFDVDLVTVYRTLELFQSLGVINKIQLEDNTARYELISADNHHHHLVCVKCGRMEEVEADESSLLRQNNKASSFQILRHSLEFFGLCYRCQN